MLSDVLREEFTHLVQAHVPRARVNGAKVIGCVPWRDDTRPSFSADLDKGVWYDHARQEGGGMKEFKERVGEQAAMPNGRQQRKIAKTYDYTDEHGTLLYQVVRFDPKDFRQRRPDGNGGWVWDLNGGRCVLYRLRDIALAERVYIVEGEKDADRLWSLGIPATTCPQGAGKWRPEYNDLFRNKQVVILPDNDTPGEHHAQQVARALLPVATAVKIVRLPDLPPKGDVSDWLDAGHTKEAFATSVKATPILKSDDVAGHEKSATREPGPKQLQWYTVSELREETAATIPYLVADLLAESSLSVIGGKIAVGKSTLARSLAYCVVRGSAFLDRNVVQGAVLYVAPEESKHGVMTDLVALGFTNEDPLHLCFASNETVIEQVLAKLQETHARLVIFETIFRVLRIKDVNDYAQSTQKLDPVLELARKTSAHVLFTHHLGKRDTTDALDALLGSTAIGGTPDTRIILKKKGDVRTVEVIQRYGQPVPETVLHYDAETKFITTAGNKEDFDKQKVRTAILETLPVGKDGLTETEPDEQRDGLTEKELDDQIEGRTKIKREVLRVLVTTGIVNRLGKGGKSDPYRYTKKDSCSLVPTIVREQQNTNQKNGLSPQESEGYSCSQDFADSAVDGNTQKSREHAKTLWEEDRPEGERNDEFYADAHDPDEDSEVF